MTFKITFDYSFQVDEDTGKLFLNGIELDETDIKMLDAYDVKPNLSVKENKNEIIYEIDINFLNFLQQKYYKN